MSFPYSYGILYSTTLAFGYQLKFQLSTKKWRIFSIDRWNLSSEKFCDYQVMGWSQFIN